MNYFVILFILFSTCTFSQVKDTNIYIPLEFLNSKVNICKYDAITPQEKNSLTAINPVVDNDGGFKIPLPLIRTDNRFNKTNEVYQVYNVILYRQLNIEIASITEKYTKKLQIVSFHERDFVEKQNEFRYIIKPDYDYSQILNDYSNHLNLKQNLKGWYIYDQVLRLKYNSFSSLELLLNTLSVINKKFPNDKKLKLTSSELNDFVNKSIPKVKVKKEMPKAAKWTLGIIAYGTFQTLLIIIPNL